MTVKVTLQIEAGRVVRAFVAEHQKGMEAYEAQAMRISRGRRYPENVSGQEVVPVTIIAPE